MHTYKILQDYVHGVNIKLEKTGGLRAALEAILLATELNLKVRPLSALFLCVYLCGYVLSLVFSSLKHNN